MSTHCFTASACLFFALLSSLLVVSCSSPDKLIKEQAQQALADKEKASYETFTSRSDYKKTYDVYRNETLINKSAKTKRLVINLGDQRGQYLVDGKIALDFPVCTGVRAHPTPTGTFSISEKKVDHRSNLYGNYSLAEAEKAKAEGTFVGTAMPYWQRLTGCGIGLHVGKVRRSPASHGCIRLPRNVGSLLYSKTSMGTRVDIIRYKGDIPVLRMPPPAKTKVTPAKPLNINKVTPNVERKEASNKVTDVSAILPNKETNAVPENVGATPEIAPAATPSLQIPPVKEAEKAPSIQDVAPVTPPPAVVPAVPTENSGLEH